MFRKLALTLIAAASLGALALAPSSASAKGGWGGGWGGGFHHHGFGPAFGVTFVGGGYADEGCYVTRRVRTPYGYRLRTFNVCY